MACIKRLPGNQKMPCGAPPANFIGSPKSAKLINASDIASFTATSYTATITRVAGAPAATNIETANNTLVVNFALKGGETYPHVADVSLECSMYYSWPSSASVSDNVLSGSGINTSVVAAVEFQSGRILIYGLGAPLSCLSAEGVSTGNGYLRLTFGVEDWQTGTTLYALSKADYEDLSNPVPSGGGDTE